MMKLVAAALGAGLSTAALAQAGAPPQAPAPGLQRDQTRGEAKQRVDMMFGMLDASRDGTVTKAEAEEALAQMEAARGDEGGRGAGRMQRMVDQAFATSPSMTLPQFEALSLSRFDAMDLNHDGTVTAAERAQVRAQRQAQ